ncbi:ion channel [Luteitalea sp.]|jgi:hypothetical protein|uniref:potassium channel family protein n=1 Tax=Luteitalea sp. TaxID=2004800 RepID=UPI0037CAD30D
MTGHTPATRSDDRELHALLLALVLALFVVPPFTLAGVVGPWLVDLLFAAVVGAGALAVIHRSHTGLRVTVTALVFAAVVAKVGRTAVGSTGWLLADAIVSAMTIALFALVILRRVFAAGPITVARIEGAVAVYLLVGVLWAMLFEALVLQFPGAITTATGVTPSATDLSYLSFVTLTTVGYGDVTPVAPAARSLAVVEALIGQLYPAVLIARLVSLEIAHRDSGDPTRL